MVKYIDAEKIRSEVERIQKTGCESPISICNDILSFIDSLQNEQPSLPSNIDEAADAYIRRVAARHPGWDWETQDIADAFKAGAEWMARQGSSFKVNVEEVPQGHWYAGLHLGGCAEEEENALKSINAKDGDKVIVQIKKK